MGNGDMDMDISRPKLLLYIQPACKMCYVIIYFMVQSSVLGVWSYDERTVNAKYTPHIQYNKYSYVHIRIRHTYFYIHRQAQSIMHRFSGMNNVYGPTLLFHRLQFILKLNRNSLAKIFSTRSYYPGICLFKLSKAIVMCTPVYMSASSDVVDYIIWAFCSSERS